MQAVKKQFNSTFLVRFFFVSFPGFNTLSEGACTFFCCCCFFSGLHECVQFASFLLLLKLLKQNHECFESLMRFHPLHSFQFTQRIFSYWMNIRHRYKIYKCYLYWGKRSARKKHARERASERETERIGISPIRAHNIRTLHFKRKWI